MSNVTNWFNGDVYPVPGWVDRTHVEVDGSRWRYFPRSYDKDEARSLPETLKEISVRIAEAEQYAAPESAERDRLNAEIESLRHKLKGVVSEIRKKRDIHVVILCEERKSIEAHIMRYGV